MEVALPSQRVLRALWSKMAGIYGARWTSSYGESPEQQDIGRDHQPGDLNDAGAAWQQALAGVTRAELSAGIGRAITAADPWPPTAPAFRALCLDIPPLSRVRHVLSHPALQDPPTAAFCRLVWRFINAYRFARADSREAEAMVREAYDLAREWRMRLGPLPPVPVAVLEPAKPQTPTRASVETAEAHMAKIAEMLKASEPPADESAETTQAAQA